MLGAVECFWVSIIVILFFGLFVYVCPSEFQLTASLVVLVLFSFNRALDLELFTTCLCCLVDVGNTPVYMILFSFCSDVFFCFLGSWWLFFCVSRWFVPLSVLISLHVYSFSYSPNLVINSYAFFLLKSTSQPLVHDLNLFGLCCLVFHYHLTHF